MNLGGLHNKFTVTLHTAHAMAGQKDDQALIATINLRLFRRQKNALAFIYQHDESCSDEACRSRLMNFLLFIFSEKSYSGCKTMACYYFAIKDKYYHAPTTIFI